MMSGRSPPLYCTLINRHAGTPDKKQTELSHLSEVRSRQSTTSHNIVRLLRSSQFFLPETEDEAFYRPRDCDMSQESQLLLDEQFRGTNVITLRSPIMNSRTLSLLSGTHVMTL